MVMQERRLSPCNNSETMFLLTAYVFPHITSYAASQIRPFELWPNLRDLELADPDPASREPIHLLIGSDSFGSLLVCNFRQGPVDTSTAQKTVFGWIISGSAYDAE